MRFMDLFCGIGGLSYGFKRAGFEPVAGLDIDTAALKVYKKNIKPKLVINKDFREVKINRELPEVDVIIGGPPCQGFSFINRYKKNGKYKILNDGVIFFAETVNILRPVVFLFENVPPTEKYPQFKYLLKVLGNNYSIHYAVVDLGLYGGGPWKPVRPLTHRRRLIAIGIRKDTGLEGKYLFPRPSADKPLPIDEVLRLDDNLVKKDLKLKKYKKLSERLRKLAPYMKRGLKRRDVPQEAKKYFYNCWLKKPSSFGDSFSRCAEGEPLPYVTGGIMTPDKGPFLHITEDRGYTLEEAKYIMSFPVEFDLSDISITKAEKYIGNAVPPQAAYAFAARIKEVLHGNGIVPFA